MEDTRQLVPEDPWLLNDPQETTSVTFPEELLPEVGSPEITSEVVSPPKNDAVNAPEQPPKKQKAYVSVLKLYWWKNIKRKNMIITLI